METGPFSVGERALVPFTDKNYEAKVLKAEFRCADYERREATAQISVHPYYVDKSCLYV